MPDTAERIAMVVVGDDPGVRVLLPLLPDVATARVDTIAEARRVLLSGSCNADTIVAYTPEFVAKFNDGKPEVPPHAWRCIVLAATLRGPADDSPYTDAALTRLHMNRRDNVVSFPVDREKLDAFLATKAGGAK